MLLAAAFAVLSVSARAEIVTAIEFYHAALDHYFVSASPSEIAALDNGVFKGWARTGLSFGVYPAGDATPGTTPVCRFYGNPAYGLDSHFYSASPAECAEVKQKWPEQWLLESYEVFRVVLPVATSGFCRSGTEPLFRLFNQRTDVNHRYLTNYGEMAATVERGYVQEGYGTPPVAMCVPYPPIQIAVAECEIEAQHSEPVATETNRLSVRCSNHPKSFAWTGCTSNSGVCDANSATPGAVTYSVVATNEVGNSAPASRTLIWQARPPICSIGITTTQPAVGSSQTLYASCDGNPTAFFWTNCESHGETCIASASSAGQQTYTLYAANAWGTGAPYAQTLDWKPATPVCTVTSKFVSASVATLTANCNANPTSYLWTNCTSTTGTCTASSTVTGPITYTVRGVNSFGTGSPASVTVDWSGPRPVCTLSASSMSPIVGGEFTLTANCSGNPTSYSWVLCVPESYSNNTCIAVAGPPMTPFTYTVTATNMSGTSDPASVTVTSQEGLAAPACTLFPGPREEYVGMPVTLFVSCTGNPTSYQWTGCTSSTSACTTTSSTAGLKTYSVTATNAAGTSRSHSTTVYWNGGTPVCTLSASNTTPKVGTEVLLTLTCSGDPGSYTWIGCTSTTSTCAVTSQFPGSAMYWASADSGQGMSNLASIMVTWLP